MRQLIERFEPGVSNSGPRRSQEDLRGFKKKIADARFVRLRRNNRRTKSLRRQLKEADGLIKIDKAGVKRTFLFSTTFERWYPHLTARKALTRLLRSHRIFGRGRRQDTCTRETFVAELGRKVPCYALSPKRLRGRAR
jgi:hypothetical protein